jgi:hypothetical protein
VSVTGNTIAAAINATTGEIHSAEGRLAPLARPLDALSKIMIWLMI